MLHHSTCSFSFLCRDLENNQLNGNLPLSLSNLLNLQTLCVIFVQQQFFSFQSILDPTLLPTIHCCLFEDKSADKWVVDLFFSRNIQNNQFTGWIPPGLNPPTFMYAFFSHNLNSGFLEISICVWDVDGIHHCSIYVLTKYSEVWL